jgi:tRNA threonylcarbamoyladenosine biosynthesis protein TsaE
MTVCTQNPNETEAIAASFATHLQNQDRIGLIGTLGSGKTCFVRGLAQGLHTDLNYMVNSPTFTIANIYPSTIPLCHFDLYRLNSTEELLSLGFDDYFNNPGIFVIEWADKFDNKCPRDLDIYITANTQNSRKFSLKTYSPRGQDLAIFWENCHV